MALSVLGLYVTRAFQFIFAIIVLGIAADLSNSIDRALGACAEVPGITCHFGRQPSSAYFATFTGVWGLLDVVIGLIAAAVTSAIPWFVVINLDILAAIFYLAGGINSAVLYGGPDCTSQFCREWQASIVFMFLGFFATIAAIVLVMVCRRNRSKHT